MILLNNINDRQSCFTELGTTFEITPNAGIHIGIVLECIMSRCK